MKDLRQISIKHALEKLRAREISATELLEANIQAAEETKSLNAFITTTYELAKKQAKQADERIKNNEALPLDGIVMSVKDLFCTKDVRTTAGSKVLEGFIPPYTASVIDRMFNNGAVMIGKNNLDQFGMGSSNENSYFGACISPLKEKGSDINLVPGGSSGGSAVSVAVGSSMVSFGTDTGGSIRQPASFLGIVGVKPTYGRCSRFGVIAFSSSLDQPGIFTRDTADAAIILEKIMGKDKNDSTTTIRQIQELVQNLDHNIKGLKIGIPKECKSDKISPEISDLWDNTAKKLEAAGAEIIEISLPSIMHSLAVYYILAPAEASSNLSRYDGVRFGHSAIGDFKSIDEFYEKTRAEAFGDEVKRRIIMGTYVLSSEHYHDFFEKAQSMRAKIKYEFDNAFKQIDAILLPTAPSDAFPVNANLSPTEMYLNDIFTIPASIAGLPAMSVPAILSKKGLPLGMQVISKPFDELTMLRVASAIELSIATPGS